MLAECLRAWFPSNDTDAKAASMVIAETVLLIRGALTKKR